MRIEIRNILGVETAAVDIPEGGVVEVAGPNAAGKSSVAAAAQAVLAHEMNPLGVPAAQAKRAYVHEGAEYGEAVLYADPGGVTTWRPANSTIETPHITPVSRPEAVGLVDFTARTGAKQRAEQLQAALLPPHGQIMDEVRRALADYLDPADLAGVMEMILERGFEAAADVYADRGRRAKQEWREITAQTWGIKVGSDWRPNGWLADYDHMTFQQAEELVVSARDALAALHTVKAVSQVDVERGKEARRAIPALKEFLNDLETAATGAALDVQNAGADVSTVVGDMGRLERLLEGLMRVQRCPHCDGAIVIENGAVKAPDADHLEGAFVAAREELAAKRAELETAQAALKAATAASHTANRAMEDARLELRKARDAADLADMDATPDHGTAIAAAEADVEKARDVVRLVADAAAADRLHETIVRYSETAKAIGPQGVRQRMLADGLRSMNAGLRRISQMTGWAPMEVDDRGGMTWATRPVQMASESERWRAQASMQLTIAAMTKARAVVLDRVDILDDRSRLAKALTAVAEKTGLGIMICATETAANPAWWPVVRIEQGRTAA